MMMDPDRIYPEDLEILENLDSYSSYSQFLRSPDSETVDIAFKSLPPDMFPVSPHGPPDRTVFPGECDFHVAVNSEYVHKKTFVYSNSLNKIYVDIKKNFSLQFHWDYRRQPHETMYVRATTVFSDETQAQNRPKRCTQHFHDSSSANMSREIAENVLHSTREIGTNGVFYCGQPDAADSWYSVLIEFRKTSPQPCTHAFKFVCKNSCSSGINRRAIAIIFTLENSFGFVYGRQMVAARVCACPKRDMHKDEEEFGKTNKSEKKRCQPSSDPPPPHKAKKIKKEETKIDDTVYTLPPLRVVGTKSLLAGLKVMKNMMEVAVECRQNEPKVIAPYNDAIADIKTTIASYENA